LSSVPTFSGMIRPFLPEVSTKEYTNSIRHLDYLLDLKEHKEFQKLVKDTSSRN
jgi:hypothetical protein